MILLIVFSFFAGLTTILAPCIWPVLPIVLSSSIAGKKGHQRPLGITLGVMLSFAIFTLSASYLVRIFHLDPNIFRLFAVIVIICLGLMMVIPKLAIEFELLIADIANFFNSRAPNAPGAGFWPGLITGLSLGVVWSPCAGPILATIASLSATGRVSLALIAVTLAYVIGIGVPLFAFAYGGRQFITKAKWVNKYTGKIQQGFGVVMILSAVAIFFNYDQTLQLQLLARFPVLNTVFNGFESSAPVQNQLEQLKGNTVAPSTNLAGIFNANSPAPDFAGIDKWFNTAQPLSLKNLKSKVVLVDFWTYTCINCLRTLPHLNSWYDKYKGDGFVVVGVHTPEFQFEHDTNNVQNALKMYDINYPVAQDNEYATWNKYNNEYWPAEYLIDAKGVIRRTHFGEGEYDQMESAIQLLLQEAGTKVNGSLDTMADQTPSDQISPETYLGSQRMQYYFPSGSLNNGTQTFTLSDNLSLNSFSYGGQWTITNEAATAGNNATLNYNFMASKVFVILRPGATKNQTVKIYLDGNLINSAQAGSDVKNGEITVDGDRLFNIVDLRGKTENRTVRLEFQAPGVQAFTFTFG